MLPSLTLSHTHRAPKQTAAYTGPLHPQPEPTLAQSIKAVAIMATTKIISDGCQRQTKNKILLTGNCDRYI